MKRCKQKENFLFFKHEREIREKDLKKKKYKLCYWDVKDDEGNKPEGSGGEVMESPLPLNY